MCRLNPGAFSSWNCWRPLIRGFNLLGHVAGDPLRVGLDPDTAAFGLAHCLYQSFPALRCVSLPSLSLPVLEDMFALRAAAVVPVRLEILAVNAHLADCAGGCGFGGGAGVGSPGLKLDSFAFLSHLAL